MPPSLIAFAVLVSLGHLGWARRTLRAARQQVQAGGAIRLRYERIDRDETLFALLLGSISAALLWNGTVFD